jgi:hypothetical protein
MGDVKEGLSREGPAGHSGATEDDEQMSLRAEAISIPSAGRMARRAARRSSAQRVVSDRRAQLSRSGLASPLPSALAFLLFLLPLNALPRTRVALPHLAPAVSSLGARIQGPVLSRGPGAGGAPSRFSGVHVPPQSNALHACAVVLRAVDSS